ncbi:DUF7133 domain-containing protein [Botryobacter ruber]|uniref:DUF7133 domain-containing protein n=1 Tax=Botryobacter ruber TaxID=2171629 RepID=UPI000E0A2DB6|nr:c-type cytochrome [Botryobacter ruber]
MIHFKPDKRKIHQVLLALGVFSFSLSVLTYCNTKKDTDSEIEGFEREVVDTNPPVTPLSPKESMKKMVLPPGYRVELVAHEPMVQEPVALAWDGNGRMYVAEMNTFMIDVNGTGQFQPSSRIKLLEDTDGDGDMDKSTVFIDNLVLPRAILPIGDQLLLQESNIKHIWAYRDTNGDGKADEKWLAFNNPQVDLRNVEHQNGALLWNLDNWIYPTRDNLRYKFRNGRLVADTLINNMTGQWGLTSDNYGQLFFSEAGPGLPAVQIEQMPHYGALNFKDQYTPEFAVPWPIIGNLDAQGGEKALREDNTLKHFTSGCGQSVYRGDRLPADMLGDYFIPEPVGRIIKRGRIFKNEDAKIQIRNVYEEKEWLASADFNFRPLNTYTGPDGCFYIVDMYHGIIQESEWSGPGTYLGSIIKDKELYKNRGLGRIYRIVHEDFEPDKTRPRMLSEPASQLVTYLEHPNGWWRDNAQLLLVVRNDKSVVPALREIALGKKASLKKAPGPVTRVHALWTLEGMGAMNKAVLFRALQDKDAQVRKAAIWISEMYIKRNDPEVISKLSSMITDPSPEVRVQLTLSLRTNKTAQAQAAVKELLARNPDNELMQVSYASHIETLKSIAAEKALIENLGPAERALIAEGATIYKQLCATCHGPDGRGRALGGGQLHAPPLAGSPRLQGKDKVLPIQIMLHGLKGPIDGKEYADMMPSMAAQSDEWIASVLSYVRNSSEFGNNASIITPADVQQVRRYTKLIPGGATLQQLEITKGYRSLERNWAK